MALWQLIPRILGTAIQLFGLLYAAIGVNNTRESYGLPPLKLVALWRASVQWLKVHVLRQRRNITAHPAGIGSVAAVGKASGHASLLYAPLDRTAPTEDQVAVVDANVRRVQAEVERVEARQAADRERLDKAEERINEVANDLRRDTDEKLRKQATEALSQEAKGLAIAALGTFIAAFG